MQTPREVFSQEMFQAEFGALFEGWKSNWANEGKQGPFLVIRGGANMSPDQLALERPEQEAFYRLVEYAAVVISVAAIEGKAKEMINEVCLAYTRCNTNRRADAHYEFFLREVFARTLEMQSPITTVDTFIGECRSKLGFADVAFGRVKVN